MKKVMTATLVLAVSLLAGCVNDPYYGDRGYYGSNGAYQAERTYTRDRVHDNGGYPDRRPERYEDRPYENRPYYYR